MTDVVSPDTDHFEAAYQKGRSQLLWFETVADLETPVSAFLKLADNQKYSFLLESVEGGAVLGRYSFLGCDPDMLWRCQNGAASIAYSADTKGFTDFTAESKPPLDSLRDQLKQDNLDIPPHLPPSCVGLFGYLGYDMIREVEDIPDNNPDPLNIPDGLMMRPQIIVVFDNIKHIMTFATPVWYDENIPAGTAYDLGVDRLNQYLSKLNQPIDKKRNIDKTPKKLSPRSNLSKAEFHGMVDKARDYILAGDIFQVVLSQRFEVDFSLPAFALYRSLRRLNPSPFLFYLNMDDFQLVGSSPEILVRLRDHKITIRPIAGTRKRGQTAEEDQMLEADLLSDPKERAEHLMLLDLGRNDVGRVAKTGSVKVTEQYKVEYYSHVMHIVSNVEGELRDEYDGLDALFSGFPAGTVSGAPKVRAMEIIDELEPAKRKFYAGCVGYLGFDGSIDSCIALRTGLVKDGKLYVQAGGGIVTDSTPEGELEESINKAKALITAAEQA
ncbi:MAG: anthranilate synthase component I [Pseudomonadota bacterium]